MSGRRWRIWALIVPLLSLAISADASGVMRSAANLSAVASHAQIYRLRTLRLPGETLIFENAATPDGRYLLVGVQPRAFPNTSAPSAIALYDISSGTLTMLHPLLTPGSQIISATANDRWIAWSEASDENDFAWTLFVADRRSGHVTQLAQAMRDASGQPYAGPAPQPCLLGDTLVWGQVIGPIAAPDLHNAVVRAMHLPDGAITTLATSAGAPSCGDPWVGWEQSDTGAPGVVVRNMQTGKQRLFTISASSLALTGASMAYIDGDLQAVHLIDDLATDATPITIASGTNLQFVSLSSRYVAWNAAGPAQAWDRAARRLITPALLPGTTLSATWAGADLLVWFDADPADANGSIINILDAQPPHP